MHKYNRILIGICAPTVPDLAEQLLCNLEFLYNPNNDIVRLPEFSYVVRFNKTSFSYYHLDGRVVSNITEIIANNIPIIRYTDPSDPVYDIVRFVSKEECVEDSVMIYQYETPMEITTELAPGVVYFHINLLPTMEELYERTRLKPFAKRPGFETVEEQVAKIYHQRDKGGTMYRYRYAQNIDTLILHSYYEKADQDELIKTILNFLFKIDNMSEALIINNQLAPKFHLFHCLDRLEKKRLEGFKNELQSSCYSSDSLQQEYSKCD